MRFLIAGAIGFFLGCSGISVYNFREGTFSLLDTVILLLTVYLADLIYRKRLPNPKDEEN